MGRDSGAGRVRIFFARIVIVLILTPTLVVSLMHKPVTKKPVAIKNVPPVTHKEELKLKRRVQIQSKVISRQGFVKAKTHQKPSYLRGHKLIPMLRAIAMEFGLSPSRFIEMAHCESGLRPDAKENPPYQGLFQHDPDEWPTRAKRAGLAGKSIWDPYANAYVTAWMIRHGGGWGFWPSCSRV